MFILLLLIYPWLSTQPSESVANRIALPAGYQRLQYPAGSFAEWLSNLPLKKGNPPVHLYDGRLKGNQEAQYAVVDIDVGKTNLQQCADAVIRLRAEYLWSAGKSQDIRFHFTSGDLAEFSRWSAGYRPIVSGNHVSWKQTAAKNDSYAEFRKYLDTVFTYSGSYSLSKELHSAGILDMQSGDVFIQGGFPGHAVIVVDVIVNKSSGKKAFLLAQSYMPAQEMHILKNPNNADLSPWYELDFGDTLVTPEWVFTSNDLKRW